MANRNLTEIFNQQNIRYSTVTHPKAYTAQRVAEAVHVSGKEFAKAVLVELGGHFALAVLPGNRLVNLESLREITGSESVRIATEPELKRLFPDCEIGAMPPFGNLYGMPTYVDPSLADFGEIAFNAGSHTEMIKMSYTDFERLAQPRVLSFA